MSCCQHVRRRHLVGDVFWGREYVVMLKNRQNGRHFYIAFHDMFVFYSQNRKMAKAKWEADICSKLVHYKILDRLCIFKPPGFSNPQVTLKQNSHSDSRIDQSLECLVNTCFGVEKNGSYFSSTTILINSKKSR